eukprot:251127_1
MASEENKELEKELQGDYVDAETKKGAAISTISGAVLGGAGGVAIGAQTGAALVIGGSIVSAPVAIPAVIGAITIGAIGTGIAHVVAKIKKIDALEKDGLKKSIDGAKQRLLAVMKKITHLTDEQKLKQQERQKLLNAISTTKQNMEKQEKLFQQQVKEHGYARNSKQSIVVMIGKTGHGKSTLGNRICGDTSKKGKEGPFAVSAKKNKAGTTEVISNITTAPFEKIGNERQLISHNPTDDDIQQDEAPDEIELEIIDLDDEKEKQQQERNLLIVDTPGWGDVDEKNQDNHKNLVVRYLKGCGGINSFIMVISNSDRIDGPTQQMLKEYETLFDVEFWKHLMIVVTGVDDEDELEEFKEEDHVTDIQKLLKDKFKHLKSLDLNVPVIPIGKKIYSKQICLIVHEVSKDKFTCNALMGPFELLKQKYDDLLIDLAAIDHKLATLQQGIAESGKEKADRKTEIDKLKSKLIVFN